MLKKTKNRNIEIAQECKIDLDIEPKTKIRKKKRINKEKEEPSRSFVLSKVCNKIKKKFLPFFPINLAPNSVYKKEDYWNLLLEMAGRDDFVENASFTLREKIKEKRIFCPNCYRILYPLSDWMVKEKYSNIFICKNCGYERRISPTADAFRYHVKKNPDVKKLQRQFDLIFDVTFQTIKNNPSLHKPIPVYAGIDSTDWPFYGKRDAKNVVGRKPVDGTDSCYKFINLDIVEDPIRFTMLTLPITQLDSQKELVRSLLRFAKQRINIGCIVADKAFYNAPMIRTLKEFNQWFLIPCTKYANVKKILEVTPAPMVLNDLSINEELYNMIIVKDKDKNNKEVTYAFATNKRFNNVEDAVAFAKTYTKRWGIETAYRKKKDDFLPKTTSKNYIVRLFYFLFSAFLYNIWILSKLLFSIENKISPYRNYMIPAKFFSTILSIILSDPG